MSGSRLDQPIEFRESRNDAEAMLVDLGYSRNGLEVCASSRDGALLPTNRDEQALLLNRF